MKWEYQIHQIGFKNPADTMALFNETGDAGWELVTIFPNAPGLDESWGMAVYKRPKDH